MKLRVAAKVIDTYGLFNRVSTVRKAVTRYKKYLNKQKLPFTSGRYSPTGRLTHTEPAIPTIKFSRQPTLNELD